MKFFASVLFITTIFSTSVGASETNTYDAWVEKLANTEFSGLVVVAKGNSIVLQKAFGLANREENKPYRLNTNFNIGSVTKQFTASAILKLQESGKLSTDDLISKYFDNVPKDKQQITIHHLLTHTAGFVATRGEGSANLYNVVTRKQLVNYALASELISLPGVQFHYSNVGYNLLAIIIEKVSGQSYESYFQSQLFKPARMNNTGYRQVTRDYNNVAVNYGADASYWEELFSLKPKSKSVGNPFEHLDKQAGPRFNMEGAGGLTSTMQDLINWHIALGSDTILSKDSKELLFKTHNNPVAEDHKYYYGYGWLISEDENGILHAQHNGSNGYSFTDYHRFLQGGIAIIISTNDIDVYPEELMKELVEITKNKL